MRGETRVLDLSDNSGRGLKFIAVDKTFIFSADHFTSYQCAKAAHREDLRKCQTTVLHIDSYMLGAGSASCGPRLKAPYKKDNLKGEILRFFVVPF